MHDADIAAEEVVSSPSLPQLARSTEEAARYRATRDAAVKDVKRLGGYAAAFAASKRHPVLVEETSKRVGLDWKFVQESRWLFEPRAI